MSFLKATHAPDSIRRAKVADVGEDVAKVKAKDGEKAKAVGKAAVVTRRRQ
jgi:hypothetical protein